MHRKYFGFMASIGKDNICSVKTKNHPEHTPPAFPRCRFSKIKHDDVELRWIREFTLHDKRQYCLVRFCYRAKSNRKTRLVSALSELRLAEVLRSISPKNFF